MTTRPTIFLFISIFSLVLIVSCKPREVSLGHLGEAYLQVSGNADAQVFFQEGLLLLHSFEYADAAEQFRLAQQADPHMVMAYWGEAMTKNHPLWNAQYDKEAQEIMERLAPSRQERLAMAETALEKDLLMSVEILFGEGDKYERDKSYSDHMGSLYKKYSDNSEVAAFYALSLLGSVTERDTEIYGHGARIAQDILKDNPKHPGALHYLIHSYDDPDHAHLALEAANSYANVAPDAAHALHMPSHIFIALGMWDEVISSNIASYEASLNRMKRKGLGTDARNYHAFHWLLYGYLQRGESDKAKAMLDEMVMFVEEGATTRTRAYLTAIRGTYLAETGDWNSDYANMEVKDDDLNLSVKAINLFVRGMKQAKSGRINELEETIQLLSSARQEAERSLLKGGAAMCAGVSWDTQIATRQDVNHTHIMEMELRAVIANLKVLPVEAENWFQKATLLEENTSFMFGPPTVIKPSHEMYGEWLIKQGKNDSALIQFEKCLQRAPKRLISTRAKEGIDT